MIRLPLVSALCTFAIATLSTITLADSPRAKLNFNPGWLVTVADPADAQSPSFDDSQWKQITLPRAWNEDSAFKVSIDDLPTGIAWYRKHFTLPASAAGKKVFIEFEGIRHGGEFYLNGEWIGRSENGIMAFGFDITDKLKPAPAENIIAARIDSSWRYREKERNSTFQWNDKNFYANYGGINRNVFLHLTDRLHQTLPLYQNLGTTGVYIHADHFDIPGRSATITAESEVRNDHPSPRTFHYQVRINRPDGTLLQSFTGPDQTLAPGEMKSVTASATVNNLRFWSWGYGYLYQVTSELISGGTTVDSVVTRTGFRKLEFSNGMVKLNDRVIQLKGYAQRSTNEWPAVGLSVPPWMSDFSNLLMVESGANLVRWMHVTPWKQDVESCDRIGLMQAMPAGDAERDVQDQRWQQRVEVMRDAIIYHRNNPSIAMYEGGNAEISEAHMAELKALRDRFDPHGGRAAGSREMLASKIAEYGGEMLYINKSARTPFWATEYSRDEGLRKYWDAWSPPFHQDGDGPPHKGEPAAAYNRNQDTHAIENVVRWFDFWRERPGTGTRCSAGGVNIVFSDSNTHHRGAENYRRSGEVDAMRLPKDGFYAHQVMWDGWVNPEHPRIHLLGHWNYTKEDTKPITAVSSAQKVELFLNQRSLGFGVQNSRFLFSWPSVAWEPGEIKAVGYDASNRPICSAALRTAGAPTAIRLTSHTAPGGLCADGADMALIDVEVVDSTGMRCPTALDLIQFKLEGPAEWRGGIAQGPDNFILSPQLPVECGINRIILRSLPQSGTITLTATSGTLEPARLTLESSPLPTEGGIANRLPGADLPAHLTRGATPAGDSVIATRRTLRIATATAGSAPENAAAAFDDNEETSWKNDGKPGSAWIQFELQQPAIIHEIVMKMGGWRNKSYPLRITVDGAQVFTSYTPKSLGYITLPLNPTLGKSIRVELAGDIEDKDGFGIVEITGKKLQGRCPAQSTALEIIEAEVYSPLPATP